MSRDPGRGVRPRPHAQPRRRARAAATILVFTSQDAYAADDALARNRSSRRCASATRVAGVVRPPAPARRRNAARALLPRLPLRARAARPAARRAGRAQLRADALLERELGHSARDLGGVPVRRRPDHERGPGVVTARAAARATSSSTSRRRPSTTRTRTRSRGVQALLRLRRLGRALVRGGRRRLRRAAPGGSAVRAGRGRVAVANGPAALDPVRGRLRAREVQRASSSGAATGGCPLALKRRFSALPSYWTTETTRAATACSRSTSSFSSTPQPGPLGNAELAGRDLRHAR